MKVDVRALRRCVVSCLVESEVDLEQADLGKFVLAALVQSTSNRGQTTRASVTSTPLPCESAKLSACFSDTMHKAQVATDVAHKSRVSDPSQAY